MTIPDESLRLKKANTFLAAIASINKNIFCYKGCVSYLNTSHRGTVFFFDCYTQHAVDTHTQAPWRHFSEASPLECLVCSLRNYVVASQLINIERLYWPSWVSEGGTYGHSMEMDLVRYAAIALGIVEGAL